MRGEIIVRMGELAVSTSESSTLTALGLGSCIGVCAYDPVSRVGGMAHVVLPSSNGKTDQLPAKSADVGVANLIVAMVRAGADKRRIRVAIAGGAQLFSFTGADTHMDVGNRNTKAVGVALLEAGIRTKASDVGGNTGRTVRLDSQSGVVTVRRVGDAEKVLVNLSV